MCSINWYKQIKWQSFLSFLSFSPLEAARHICWLGCTDSLQGTYVDHPSFDFCSKQKKAEVRRGFSQEQPSLGICHCRLVNHYAFSKFRGAVYTQIFVGLTVRKYNRHSLFCCSQFKSACTDSFCSEPHWIYLNIYSSSVLLTYMLNCTIPAVTTISS